MNWKELHQKMIDRIYKRLREEHWGDIEPNWFEYIDLDGDTSGYEDDHIEFQKVLQGQ